MANVPYQSYKPAAPDPTTVIRTDTIDGVQYQIVKIDIGAAGASVPLKADGLTRALVTIEYEHHEIHDGTMYSVQFEDLSMASTDVLDIKIITPATGPQMHLLWQVYGSEAHTISLIEASTVTAGTPIVPLNWNRNSLNASLATVTHTPTGAVGGTSIYSRRFGAGNSGAETRSLGERVLLYNTTYLFRVTANSAGMVVSVELDWYEHTPL